MSKTVAAVFDNYSQAEAAARQIKERGLRTDDISIVAKERDQGGEGANAEMGTGNSFFAGVAGGIGAPGGTNVTGGAAPNDNISDGVMTGGILGGLAGLLIGAGSMVIPGLGIVAAAGPITGLLSGAVTGGIVGGLIDLGIPESRSRQFETDIKAGKILFTMRTDDDKVESVASVLRENGATSVETY